MDSELSDIIANKDEAAALAFIRSHSPPINVHDRYGCTPLIMATLAQMPSVVSTLLNKGALVDEADFRGCTALFWSVEFNNIQIAQMLLSAGANPNMHSAAGQPILAYPLLRRHQEMGRLLVDNGGKLSFARDYIQAKLIGHRFELENKVHIYTPKPEFIRISFEGFFLEFTLSIIRDSLITFMESRAFKRFSDLAPLIHKITSTLEIAATLRSYREQEGIDHHQHDEQISQLLENDPLIIPVAYEGHAITFVRYQEQVAQCDRGALSKHRESISIYKMRRPEQFTADLLKTLIYDNHTGSFINMQLLLDLGLDMIDKIPTESQVAGNCSWANVEASVACLLAMFLMQGTTDKVSRIAAREKAMTFYTAWREWDKDRALNLTIETFRRANKARKASKAAILGAVLFQRLDPGNLKDVERAQKIMAILRKPDYRFIVESYVHVHYNARHKTEKGKRLYKLLKQCGEDIKLYQ